MDTLQIFYTANINGDLQILPRLHTFIQQLKATYESPPLLLDLGASCNADVWHCALTKGRSSIIVLDGMGYHAANVSGFLQERTKVTHIVSTGLVDESHLWRYDIPPVRDDGIIVSGVLSPALTLCIIAVPAAETTLALGALHLQTIEKGQVGAVTVDLQAMRLDAFEIHTMPAKIKPDATITAAVEFVEDEARYYQQQNSE